MPLCANAALAGARIARRRFNQSAPFTAPAFSSELPGVAGAEVGGPDKMLPFDWNLLGFVVDAPSR